MSNGVPAYSHIVVVVEENTNYDEIAGNTAAPYINSLMAGGANLTNFDALTHPSQPNYFALYAGSTFGTTDDNSYSEPDPTLYTILKGAGLTFGGYVDEGGGGSDFNHDPWVSFPEGRSVQTDFTSFPSLFPSGNYASLPSVSYVIPSITDDMHSGTIAQADTWLQQNLSAYAQWAKANNSLLVVVWDESDDSSSQTTNQIPALLYGANITPGNYNTAYNDYNLLATIADAFNVTAPNDAATAAPISGVFSTTPAAPTIASPASGSTDTTTAEPAIAGTGVSGDTVTVSIDGTVAGTAPVVNSAWSYTPTSPLSNASHTISATQAAAGGPGSTAATDTFTVAVSSGGAGSSFVNTEFSGITDPNNYPPENALAVDASNVVMAESSKIEWTNLSGGAAVNESLYTLFGSLPASETNSLIDVRVGYDSVNQRFVVMADNLGSNVSDIDIAVSKDSNPNDGWYVGSANSELTISGSATQADMPYLSVDGTNIYVSASQYGSTFAGTEEWVFSDSGIYTGGALNTVTSQLAPPGPGIVRNVSGGNGSTYYVAANPNGGQTVLTFQTYNSTSNSFNSTTTIALGDSDQGAGPNDYTVAQKGTSLLLNAYDSRVASLAYSNGFVYGVSEIEPSGSSVPEIEWFKINVSNPNAPTLAAQGQITGAAIGSGVGVFNPSLAVDAAGDVLVNFTASGASIYPTDYYAYEDAGGSSFSAAAPYQSSTSYFNSGASGAQRWGTYSTAIVDPNNPSSFWISNEYVASNWWQTVAAQVQLSPTGATPPVAPTIASPASGSTDTTTAEPVISGGGVSGDTVTVSIDGTQVGTALVSNSAWSYTPTSPLSNASHTVSATQAASGGP
ncbi:MAG: alkaline phosphatase family protein, partial [Roseiarcus sp.]